MRKYLISIFLKIRVIIYLLSSKYYLPVSISIKHKLKLCNLYSAWKKLTHICSNMAKSGMNPKTLQNTRKNEDIRSNKNMIKVLFVCHGNICRSPMAEFILKNMVAESGLSDQFEIASAATSTEEIWNGVGNPVYPPAQKELARHGISCEGKRAVQLKREDYDSYDYLIGMDDANIRSMEKITGHKGGKIYKLLQFADSDASVIDPWYSGRFDDTYRDVVTGCEAFLEYLRQQEII